MNKPSNLPPHLAAAWDFALDQGADPNLAIDLAARGILRVSRVGKSKADLARKARGGKCGALARSTGKPCQARGVGKGGRCKLHGGASTGPRTPEGLARLQEAVRLRWQRWRSERGLEGTT